MRALGPCCHVACIAAARIALIMLGFGMGLVYYHYLLLRIPFPGDSGAILGLLICLLLAIGNIISSQLACITLLMFPVWCGKPGRGVIKVIVLTFVISGPITNMALNAKEVVRVYACSNQFTFDMYQAKYSALARPVKYDMLGINGEINQLMDVLRFVRKVVAPINTEIEYIKEVKATKSLNDHIDDLFRNMHRSDVIEDKYYLNASNEDTIEILYRKKLEYRCQEQISNAMHGCMRLFRNCFETCTYLAHRSAARFLCPALDVQYMCNFVNWLDIKVCDSSRQVNPGLSTGYAYLKGITHELANKTIKIYHLIEYDQDWHKIQDAKQTGERVQNDFEEKMVYMRAGITAVNVFAAMLCLKVWTAAAGYHDAYLTSIQHDNLYVTQYFKRIDSRRRKKFNTSLLPLKKMERSRYVDVYSLRWLPKEYNKLFTQILKVMLEVITATTFVMLDRLFYEALDVVRQHAETLNQEQLQDLNIKVDGLGIFASMLTKTLNYMMGLQSKVQMPVTGSCTPRPRLMPAKYFLLIYGGYLWTLLLLCINPYTARLLRLICSNFYPVREKQRILHLYNDLLKKRFKMQKTLRRNAVQAVRAHYLSGESMLSMRMKFPQVLNWLSVFPAARMACLICGETEPRNKHALPKNEMWHNCTAVRCPFVFCDECWMEVGERCLACDPSLRELSDVDSLSDDELPQY